MGTKKISRAQWAQIEKRVRQVQGVFDPKWKCLIDGADWNRGRCEHDEQDQTEIIAQVKERVGV